MNTFRRRSGFVPGVRAPLIIPSNALQARDRANKKPSLSLKASPAVSFAPARIVVVAEVKGGANDFEEFYCPSVEWEWGDLTTSTAKRTASRTTRQERDQEHPGGFRIVLRLKKGTKIIATANTLVQVRAGLGQ